MCAQVEVAKVELRAAKGSRHRPDKHIAMGIGLAYTLQQQGLGDGSFDGRDVLWSDAS